MDKEDGKKRKKKEGPWCTAGPSNLVSQFWGQYSASFGPILGQFWANFGPILG
jgi:hypothetical protein